MAEKQFPKHFWQVMAQAIITWNPEKEFPNNFRQACNSFEPPWYVMSREIILPDFFVCHVFQGRGTNKLVQEALIVCVSYC